MNELKDYYQILDISPFSSLEEIKKAYKTQMKIWHPDINKSQNAHKKSIEIQEAFQILSIPEKRALYDNFYFNFYVRNKNLKSPSTSELDILSEIILETRRQSKIFINKGYSHFIKIVNEGVSFINYIFFILSILYITFFGVSFGGMVAYFPIKEILSKSKDIDLKTTIIIILCSIISLTIIYKTIKFSIYKLKNGPNPK